MVGLWPIGPIPSEINRLLRSAIWILGVLGAAAQIHPHYCTQLVFSVIKTRVTFQTFLSAPSQNSLSFFLSPSLSLCLLLSASVCPSSSILHKVGMKLREVAAELFNRASAAEAARENRVESWMQAARLLSMSTRVSDVKPCWFVVYLFIGSKARNMGAHVDKFQWRKFPPSRTHPNVGQQSSWNLLPTCSVTDSIMAAAAWWGEFKQGETEWNKQCFTWPRELRKAQAN